MVDELFRKKIIHLDLHVQSNILSYMNYFLFVFKKSLQSKCWKQSFLVSTYCFFQKYCRIKHIFTDFYTRKWNQTSLIFAILPNTIRTFFENY